ncbi:MAG: hypothetical protein JXB23_10860 [Candidatus Aminicenantes bacterium]|nr:hypothetical protein [Candidatus Aminicenantes bacterium]
MKIEGISLQDLALLICDYLAKNTIEVILTGGACVAIYAVDKYVSYDLDFVLLSYTSRKKVKSLLERIGFRQERRHFKHVDTPFLVEFLAPPLSIGEEPPLEISEIYKGDRVLRLLSPTDCVKDRLAAYYHWNDKQSLAQAMLVCRDKDIDMDELERWSIHEGMKSEFDKIKFQLQK